MPHKQLDRFAVKMHPLSARTNRASIEEIQISPDRAPRQLTRERIALIKDLVARIREARRNQRPVVVAYGAHAIKNGLGLVLRGLVDAGWVTHLATNGAGVIHDWEFAFQGKSCENVGQMVDEGKFGNWQETGFYINLAINVGAYEGLGYGESVGAMIQNEMLMIPSAEQLESDVREQLSRDPRAAAAAADLLAIVQRFQLESGPMAIPHPWKQYSVQAGAFAQGVPSTGHPMIGHDIIYNHPMNYCASLGRAAERDFLAYAESIRQLAGGVYLSIGSAVMSPMIFEKSLSMSQNLAIQRGEHIDDHYIFVNDLSRSTWDWSQGEPPEDNPAYYLRFNKTFSRMGGTMRYLTADNRDFLLTMIQMLESE